MATTETKSTKGAKITKAKAAKPKTDKTTKDKLIVFAFRLTPAERNAIHKTAGPARASRFVRRVAVAFANESETEFRAVLKEAQAARS